MKGNDPILPPGVKFDGARRGRSNMRMAVVVVVMLHLALFAGILFNACKQKDESESEGGENQQSLADEMKQIVGQPSPSPAEPTGMPPLPGTTGNQEPVTSAPAPLPTPIPSAPVTLPPDPTATAGLPPTPAPTGFPGTTGSLVPAPAPAGTQHTVASGENFWTIARQYGVTAKSIENANPTIVPTKMKVGQKIKIPAKTAPTPAPAAAPAVNDPNTYTVKSGDTLGHIAMRNKVKVKDLKAINGLTTDLIRVGQKLKLPISAALPLPTPLPTLPGPGAGTGTPVPRIELDPATGLPVSSPSGPPAPGL